MLFSMKRENCNMTNKINDTNQIKRMLLKNPFVHLLSRVADTRMHVFVGCRSTIENYKSTLLIFPIHYPRNRAILQNMKQFVLQYIKICILYFCQLRTLGID